MKCGEVTKTPDEGYAHLYNTDVTDTFMPALTSGWERWAAAIGCAPDPHGVERRSGNVCDGLPFSAALAPPGSTWAPVAFPCLARPLLGGKRHSEHDRAFCT